VTDPSSLPSLLLLAPVPLQNPYDVRKKVRRMSERRRRCSTDQRSAVLQCDKEGEDGPLCYREMLWVEDYLNKPDIQAELGMRGASA